MVMFLSIFVSLLPNRWRGHWLSDGNLDIRRGAILSASVQFVGCAAILWALYPAYLRARTAEAMAAMSAAGHAGDRLVEGSVVFAAGSLSLFQYMFRPLSLLFIYFLIEGAVRIFATVASDEVMPTLPLLGIAWLHDLGRNRYHEVSLGARVPDIVEPDAAGRCELRVQSCRPKDWDRLIAINYNDTLYELQGEESAPPPRRWVYLLRRHPAGKVARGVRQYDPEEPVQKKSGWAEEVKK